MGNVKVTYADSTVETLGDTIFRSEAGRFDKFNKRGRIDVAIGDGENVIRLESYADRILEFKDKTLHIINAAGKVEFLEDSFKYKGVDNPQAVVRTDYGVAWVNSFGSYLYDGREIHDLLEDQTKRKITKENWAAFVTPTSMVGYNPSKRQIIIVDSYVNADSDGDIFLYDIPTRSWVKGNVRVDSGDKTNFIIKHSDDRTTSELVYAKNTGDDCHIEKWSDSSAVGTIDLQLKDEDFGHPHVRKKIHKVYITSKYATDITLTAAADGSGGSDLTFDTDTLNAGANWGKTEHKVTAGGNNIYSVQLKLSGLTAQAGFEINDLSIIYRIKGVK